MPAPISVTMAWLVIAVVAAFMLAGTAARRTGAEREALDDLIGTMALWALLGSRLIYAILDPITTVREPLRLLMLKGIVSVWGAAVGALAALAFLLWKRRLKRPNLDGALLILASIMPILVLAWSPEGAPSTPLFALVGETHQVSWYYAVAHTAIAVGLWLRPQHLVHRFFVLSGVAILLIDNFRDAPLLFESVSTLQIVGAAMAGYGLLLSDRFPPTTKDLNITGNDTELFPKSSRIDE